MKTKDDQKREWRKYKAKVQAKYYARKMAETGCKTLEEYKEHVIMTIFIAKYFKV